jgi:hypothetical protein
MVQQQLVDYIGAQIKLGASRDAIKGALVSAGWQTGDVEDSFKKIDGVSSQPAAVASAAPASFGGASAARPVAMGGVTGASANSFFSKSSSSAAAPASDTPVIRMSDLVSTSSGSMATSTSMAKKPAMSAGPTSPTQSMGKKSMLGTIALIVCIVLILGLGGLAGYLYTQNTSLSAKASSLMAVSGTVTSQMSSLTAQVGALTASSTVDANTIAGLISANTELTKELSFYAVPAGSTPTSSDLSITGSLGITGSKMYILVGSFGGRITIANSKDPKVVAVLAPLVSSSTQLTGTYTPGSDMMTVTAVNGTSL